jgi:hypothetical protein
MIHNIEFDVLWDLKLHFIVKKMFFSKPKLFTQFGEWTLVQTLDLIKVILVTSSKLKMLDGLCTY